jgi:hypothetical protein
VGADGWGEAGTQATVESNARLPSSALRLLNLATARPTTRAILTVAACTAESSAERSAPGDLARLARARSGEWYDRFASSSERAGSRAGNRRSGLHRQ